MQMKILMTHFNTYSDFLANYFHLSIFFILENMAARPAKIDFLLQLFFFQT